MSDQSDQIRYARVAPPVIADPYANTLPPHANNGCGTDGYYMPPHLDTQDEGRLAEPGFAEDSELTILNATSEVLGKVADDLAGAAEALEIENNESRQWDWAVLNFNLHSLETILSAISSQEVRTRAANNYSFRGNDDSDFNRTAHALIGFMDQWARGVGGYPVNPRPTWLRPAHEMQRRACGIIFDHLSQYYDLHAIQPGVGEYPYDINEVRPMAKVAAENGQLPGSIAAVLRPGFRFGYDGSIARPAEVTVYERAAAI